MSNITKTEAFGRRWEIGKMAFILVTGSEPTKLNIHTTKYHDFDIPIEDIDAIIDILKEIKNEL